jgi:hypothetical protein
MMRSHRFLAIAATLAVTGACTAMLTPAVTTYPADAPMDFSQLATMKHGESCAVTYLFFFGPQGRATVAAAAQKVGLRRVRYVDNRYENQYWRQRYCVVAYGE